MNKRKYKKSSLEAFSIKTGGGMNGERNMISVRFENDNTVTVYKSASNLWYLNPQAELYVAASSLLDRLLQIILDEKLYNASKLPISKMQVLDAPTTSYHATFSDGEYFSYSTAQKLSSKIYSACKKIEAVIEEYCSGATAYPTVYAEAEGEYTDLKNQKGITLDCSNSSAFSLNLNIYNGNDEKTELAGNVAFSKIEGGKAVYTDILAENRRVELYAESNDCITLELPRDRYPKEGKYKIEYAGHEAVFEMKVYKIK